MASRFSDIGLPVRTFEEFARWSSRFIERMLREGMHMPVRDGRYVCWRMGGGAELWLQVSADASTVLHTDPYFAGPSRVRLLLSRVIPRTGPLDADMYAWARPVGARPDRGDYRLVFHVPDIARESRGLPAVQDVQVSAFADAVAIDRDDTAESFVGMEDGPHTRFTGRVLDAGLRRNEVTGLDFVHLRVKTPAMTLDVVADPALLPRPARAGDIVRVEAWLTGRIVETPR